AADVLRLAVVNPRRADDVDAVRIGDELRAGRRELTVGHAVDRVGEALRRHGSPVAEPEALPDSKCVRASAVRDGEAGGRLGNERAWHREVVELRGSGVFEPPGGR